MKPASQYFSRLAALLLTSTLLCSPAGAANLPDISADQIRQDSEQRYNSLTGKPEIVAPSFDPFELDDTLAGTASLRSATYATTIDGRNVSGGAFLDINLIYTTGSNDPFDNRGIDRGIYLSGQPVDAIRYDNRVLDCSENTREVVYDDGYYSGAAYGYLAGVYRLFPRYRGHRYYGDRYFAGYRGRHFRDRGYRQGRRYYHDRGQHHDRDDRYDNDHHSDRDRDRDREGRDGRRGRAAQSENGNLVAIPTDRAVRRQTRARRGTKERALQDQRRNSQHNLKDPKRRSAQTSNRTVKRPAATPSVTAPRAERQARRTIKAPTPQRPRAIPTRTEKAPTQTRAAQSTPTRSTTPQARPARQTSKAPTHARPARNTSKTPKADKRAVSRSVDRHFGRKESARGKKSLNFYPMQLGGYQRVDVQVSYRCAREESLTLHIPQDRLDAARFEGFTILLLDRDNQEIPVYIPPNYVEGFRRAASGLSSVQPYSPPPTYSYPQSSPSGAVRDPSAPIIYGETGL